MIKSIGIIALIFFAVIVGKSWQEQPAQPITIAKLDADPHAYYGRKVRVTGMVLTSTGILGRGAYRVRDMSGAEILILSTYDIPLSGRVVTVQGTLQQAMVIDTRQYQVLIQDDAYTSMKTEHAAAD